MKLTEEQEKKYIPWCLCRKRWYRIAFRDNPIISNRFYHFWWVDPESWLEWWHLGAPVRFYYKNFDKWIDFPFISWRDDQLWDHDNLVKLEPRKLPDADDPGRGT